MPRPDDLRFLSSLFRMLRLGATCYARFLGERRAGLRDKVMEGLAVPYFGSGNATAPPCFCQPAKPSFRWAASKPMSWSVATVRAERQPDAQ